jgi:hypothetical protein
MLLEGKIMKILSYMILAASSLAIFVVGWWGEKICAAENAGTQENPAPTGDTQRCKVSPKDGGRPAGISPGGTNIHSQLKQVVDISGLTFDTTFGESIQILRNSTKPPLNIVVLWRDLRENAFIDASTPIQIEGISGIPLRYGLELLLRSVSSRRASVGYIVKNGVIIIGTSQSLPTRRVVRVYDITDLIAAYPSFGFGIGPIPMPNQPTGIIGGRTYGGTPRGVGRYSGAYTRPARRTRANTPSSLSYLPLRLSTQVEAAGESKSGGRLATYPRAGGANEIARLIQNTIEPDSWQDSQ